MSMNRGEEFNIVFVVVIVLIVLVVDDIVDFVFVNELLHLHLLFDCCRGREASYEEDIVEFD